MSEPGEDRYTPANDWCRQPGRWHSADADATETEVAELVYGFVRALQPDLVVETGAYLGHTTAVIGAALARNGHGRCDAIEILPDRAARAAAATAHLPVQVICGSSLAYRAPGSVGFAWLDSDIDFRPVEMDLLWSSLEDGAVVGVHDTAPHHRASHPGFLERASRGLCTLNLRTPRGAAFFQVSK